MYGEQGELYIAWARNARPLERARHIARALRGGHSRLPGEAKRVTLVRWPDNQGQDQQRHSMPTGWGVTLRDSRTQQGLQGAKDEFGARDGGPGGALVANQRELIRVASCPGWQVWLHAIKGGL